MGEAERSAGRTGMSKSAKVLTGCGLGCLAVVVIGTVTCIAGWSWLTAPGEQVDPARLATAADYGYLVIDDLGTDPGLRALSLLALDEAASATGARVEEGADFLPRDVAVVVLADAERLVPVGVVNLPKATRLIRTVIEFAWPNDGEASTTEHRGHEIRTVGGSLSGAFVGSTILLGPRPGDVALAIDRSLEARSDGTADARAAALRERWDVWGRLTDGEGRLGPWLTAVLLFASPSGEDAGDAAIPPAGAIRGAQLGLDVIDARVAEGELEIEFVDAEAARAWAPHVGPALEALARHLGEDGVTVRAELTARGERVAGPVEVRGLDVLVSSMARAATEKLDRATSEAATP